MADRENLELDDVLEKIVFYSFDLAKRELEEADACTPFTVVVQGDEMFVEEYPAADVVSCRKSAEANVKSSSSFSTHYAFCYDGFLMTDDGQVDALIVECAQRDMEKALMIALIYKVEDGVREYVETPAFVSEKESFYDAATVRAVEAREAVEARDDAELEDAQELLRRNLSGSRAGDGKPADAEPGQDGEEGA